MGPVPRPNCALENAVAPVGAKQSKVLALNALVVIIIFWYVKEFHLWLLFFNWLNIHR